MARFGARAEADTVTAAVLTILGLCYGALALTEGIGPLADTGAGFFPLIVAVVLVASSAWVLVRRPLPAEPADDSDDDSPEGGIHWWRVAGVVLAAMLVPLFGAIVGMIVTLSISLVFIAKIMGVRRWSSAVLLGGGFGAASWLIFVYWLFVPLPAGTLGLV